MSTPRGFRISNPRKGTETDRSFYSLTITSKVSEYLIPARGLKQEIFWRDFFTVLPVSEYLIPARGLKHVGVWTGAFVARPSFRISNPRKGTETLIPLGQTV